MNLIGEHTDYNGGYVMPFAIDQAILISLYSVSDDSILPKDVQGCDFVASSNSFESEILTASLSGIKEFCQALKPGEELSSSHPLKKSWTSYVLGAFYHLLANDSENKVNNNNKIVILYDSSLPIGAGISSSACCSTGSIAILYKYFGLDVSVAAQAKSAMLIEHQFSGTKCGQMDQLAIMASKAGFYTRIDFNQFQAESKFDLQNVKAHENFSKYIHVGFNTNVQHDLTNSPYNYIRQSCYDVLDKINKKFNTKFSTLGDLHKEENAKQVIPGIKTQEDIKKWLQNELLTDVSEEKKVELSGYAAHAICENFRMLDACKAIADGDCQGLDDQMSGSHNSLDQDYHVSCDELNIARKSMRETCASLDTLKDPKFPALIGARMMGGGFGGSTIQLVREDILEKVKEIYSKEDNSYTKAVGKLPTLLITSCANGTEFINK